MPLVRGLMVLPRLDPMRLQLGVPNDCNHHGQNHRTHLVLTVKHDGLPVVVRPLPIPLLLILALLRVE